MATLYDGAELAWLLWRGISNRSGGVGPVSVSATEGTASLLHHTDFV